MSTWVAEVAWLYKGRYWKNHNTRVSASAVHTAAARAVAKTKKEAFKRGERVSQVTVKLQRLEVLKGGRNV